MTSTSEHDDNPVYLVVDIRDMAIDDIAPVYSG